MKKLLSMILVVCLTVTMLASLGIAGGFVNVSALYMTNEANELWLLEGSSSALIRGVRHEIQNESEPYRYMGQSMTAYVPLEPVAKYMGASYSSNSETATVSYGTKTAVLTIGSREWKLNGVSQDELLLDTVIDEKGSVLVSLSTARVVLSGICTRTLNVWLAQQTGLVVFSESTIGYNENHTEHLGAVLNVLNTKMLFATPTGQEIYDAMDDHIGLDTHPRIFATQEKFDEIREFYLAGKKNSTDPQYYGYIDGVVLGARSFVTTWFEELVNGSIQWRVNPNTVGRFRQPYYEYDANGNRIGETTLGGGGYDEPVGRLNQAPSYASELPAIAFAYQATGDEKFAYAAYLLIKQFGTWVHWGDCHTLNLADSALSVAKTIDWIWPAFDDDVAKRDEMCEILYQKALVKAYHLVRMEYYAVDENGKSILSHRPNGCAAHYSPFSTNNWQPVVGSGMMLTALTLMGNPRYDAYAKQVVDGSTQYQGYLYNQYRFMSGYAPDGSYLESPGYWGYGTGSLFQILGALDTCVGDDYGFLDALGLKNSFYFVAYICDANFMAWNYHDGNGDTFRNGSSWFYMAAKLYDDPTLAYFRDLMLDSGVCSFGLEDILYYEKGLGDLGKVDLSLDYFGKNIETVTMRDKWEPGADFVGLHAGANHGPHSHFDSGSFYINLDGVLWSGDPGSPSYALLDVFGNSRYYYYQTNPEAHNTVVIRSKSLPYGQVETVRGATDCAEMTVVPSENATADGAFTLVNMKPNYGATCTSGTRGMLYTNSRSTVVVQDEITFNSPTDMTWIASVGGIYKFSEDRRTVYASTYVDGKTKVLRITLVSDDESLKFETSAEVYKSNYGTILDKTVTRKKYIDNPNILSYKGEDPDQLSDPANRLIINVDDVTEFKAAVVFEIIRDEAEVVGYEWKDMSSWASAGIKSDEWVKDANSWIEYPVEEEPKDYKYTVTDLIMAMNKIDRATTTGEKMKAIGESFVKTTSIDTTNAAVAAKIAELSQYYEEYNAYVRAINAGFSNIIPYVAPIGGKN